MASAYKGRHLKWQKYAEKELAAGRKPIPFKDYQLEPAYFKFINKQTTESQLKRSGITDKEIARFKRKK